MKIHAKGFIDLEIEFVDDSPTPQPPMTTSGPTAGEAIEAGDAVYLDQTGQALRASAIATCGESYKSNVVGLARNSVERGGRISLVRPGESSRCRPVGDLVIGKCAYLGTEPGTVSANPPSAKGTFILKVGIAKTPTDLAVKIGEPIYTT